MLPSNWLDILKAEYPKRSGGQGWGIVRRKIPSLVASGAATWDDILDGTRKFKSWAVTEGKERTGFVMQAQRFYGPGEYFQEDWETSAPVSDFERSQQAREERLDAMADKISIDRRKPLESLDSYATRIRTTESERRADARKVVRFQ